MNNILVNVGFKVGSENPIDGKAKVETIEERNALVSDGLAYESLRTYVTSEKKWYEYDGSTWNEITEGGASTADAVGYVNDTISSTNVEEALNVLVTDSHTHANKEVLDLLTATEEGELQYNGTTIGGDGGASTADAISYVNEAVGSATVDDALNTVIAELHTHDNKEVLDLLSENEEGKLQYNGVAIGGEGGASTADAVEYINDAVGSTNVEEALNKLISDYYYVKPSINSFTATPNGGIFEVGHVVSAPITFNWNYNKDITTQTLTDCTLADETVRTATYNTDITTNKTFTLSANDGKNNVSKSVSYTFVSPYYTGVSTTDTLTETDIKALTKKVETKGNKTINYTTTQSYMVFAYPVSYDAISSIIDQNGFNVTDSFVRNTVTVNSVEYYVYCSNKCSGSYTMTFKY